MHPEPLRRLVRSLCQAAEPAGGERPADAELLARFVARRDEAAFELLLWRHGPMVLAVCRRLLADPHDAEDAFQATFLALVRKAGAITQGEAVGSWLCRVAYRVALRARAARARRARREQPGLEQVAAPPAGDPLDHDFRQVLDEEIDRLPARQRTAFILCCLEGKTGAEAARQLGCAPGTVSSRLTRAREQLRRRLARRGLAPSAGALAAVLAGQGPAAPLPAGLVDSTLKAVLLFAAGKTAGGVLSGRAVTLAEGVLRTMFLTRLRMTVLLLLLAGLLAVGDALARRHAVEAAPPGDNGKEGPVAVKVVKPQPGGLERTTKQACHLSAYERVKLDAEVSGRLVAQTVDIGDHVTKGQLLAEIDARRLMLEERQALAAVGQAKGVVREAEARVATARVGVEAGRGTLAQKEAEVQAVEATLAYRQKHVTRMTELLGRASPSVDQRTVGEAEERVAAARGQLAAARAAVKTAQADLDVCKSKVAQAEAGLETARADLEAAQVTLEKAQYQRGLARVTAPFDGVITWRGYSPGDYYLSAAQGGAEHQPLLTVVRTDRMRVQAAVPVGDARLTRVGAPVDLTFDALPDLHLPVQKIARIGVEEEAHTMRVEIDVANPKQQLWPGMSAWAVIHLGPGSPRALRVPTSCLVRSGDRDAVYVVRDGKARRTRVTVGTKNDNEAEVLSSLKPDDLVVTDPGRLKGDVVPVEATEKPASR
jgi:RNA polymerase sigma factor (sigma-70 family)